MGGGDEDWGKDWRREFDRAYGGSSTADVMYLAREMPILLFLYIV